MKSYDFDIVVSNYDDFVKRTRGSCPPDPARSIEQNLVDLCNWVVRNRSFVALNHSAIMQLFSRNSIRDVVFLIRHPVDAYASFGEPVRHAEMLEAFGGSAPNARSATGPRGGTGPSRSTSVAGTPVWTPC